MPPQSKSVFRQEIRSFGITVKKLETKHFSHRSHIHRLFYPHISQFKETTAQVPLFNSLILEKVRKKIWSLLINLKFPRGKQDSFSSFYWLDFQAIQCNLLFNLGTSNFRILKNFLTSARPCGTRLLLDQGRRVWTKISGKGKSATANNPNITGYTSRYYGISSILFFSDSF